MHKVFIWVFLQQECLNFSEQTILGKQNKRVSVTSGAVLSTTHDNVS